MSMKIKMLNESLRILRLYWGKSQEDLAAELGISQSYLSEIERGRKEVTIEILQRYSDLLHIPMSSLMLFAEQMEGEPPLKRGRLFIANKTLNLLNNYFPTKLMRSKIEAYPLERSPWVGLGTQRAFARLVRIPLKELKSLAAHREDCYWTRTKIIGDKERNIACPIKKMRELHETLKRFFNRIQQPEYLYSPRRKHTAIMNAVLHQTGRVVVKLDIRQFYPKTTDEHVFRFLHHQLNMPDDVAGLITKLVTFEKKLPFGSPLSPVLCTLVHRDMFDRIHGYCALEDHTLSIWVDDLTISGLDRKDALTKAIRRETARKGLETHKLQRRRIKRGMMITGIYISNDTIAPSNKTHVKIRDKL